MTERASIFDDEAIETALKAVHMLNSSAQAVSDRHSDRVLIKAALRAAEESLVRNGRLAVISSGGANSIAAQLAGFVGPVAIIKLI